MSSLSQKLEHLNFDDLVFDLNHVLFLFESLTC